MLWGDQRQFSRRNISSNWERYEDLEQDTSDEDDNNDNVLRRGEDFNVLLQRSADPASQFRFQSEKDWEQESDGDSGTMQATSVLEIDFGALATSLNCVPLLKRLDISQDGIHPDIIDMFQLKAQTCSKDHCISPSSEDGAITKSQSSSAGNLLENAPPHAELQASHSTKNAEQEKTKRTLQKTESKSCKIPGGSLNGHGDDAILSKHSGFTSEPGTLQNTENLQNSLKDVLKNVNTANSPQTGRTEEVIKSGNNEEDEDLDFLLSLDTPGVNSNGGTSCPAAGQSKKLDTSFGKGALLTTNPSADQFTKKGEDDLEDWLDSVLG